MLIDLTDEQLDYVRFLLKDTTPTDDLADLRDEVLAVVEPLTPQWEETIGSGRLYMMSSFSMK